MPSAASPPPEPLDDRVLECAALARKIAPTTCRPGAFFASNCVWYHGFWPYLRAAGVVTTPTHHGEFYADRLGELARGGETHHVLISGSSDFTMLQHVFSAFGADRDPKIVFTDICGTPVRLAEWYAEVNHRIITARATDILDFETVEPFDVICTHSFLGAFDDTARIALVKHWHRLLRPGGKIVTINRIRPYAGNEIIRFDADQIERFAANARAAIERRPAIFDITPDEMEASARKYAESFEVNPIRAVDDIDALFRENGFDVDAVDIHYVEGKKKSEGAGPTTPEGAAYAHIVVTRS